jgi:hypothetical protein
MLGFLLISISYAPHAANLGLTGLWETIDDRTGDKKAIVKLVEKNGKIEGQIVKIFWKKNDNKICIHCKDALKNKPIVGIRFLWDLEKQSQNYWSNGSILDPHNGKVYRVNIKKDGKRLFVRAYLGISLLGRTQIWHKHLKE